MSFLSFLGFVAMGIMVLAMFPRVGMVVGHLLIALAGFIYALPALFLIWAVFFSH